MGGKRAYQAKLASNEITENDGIALESALKAVGENLKADGVIDGETVNAAASFYIKYQQSTQGKQR